jgi:membrane protease YdiL (CAAX protease family)
MAAFVDSLRTTVRAHPVLATSVPTIAVGWIGFLSLIAAGLDPTPAVLLLSAFFIIVQIVVNWLIGGWPEVRRVFGRLLIWRFNPLMWLVVLVGSPLATLAVAAVTGTLQDPAGGWGPMIVNYVISTVLIGALIVNLWEESLWGGMVQGRLMAKHGLLVGSLLSAIPFALVHLPLAFGAPGFFATPMDKVMLVWAVLIGTAPFFRYLMGMMLLETRGSTLAIGLLHASWNASSSLPAVNGGWQYIGGLLVLIVVVAAWRLARKQSLVSGHAPELAPTPA